MGESTLSRLFWLFILQPGSDRDLTIMRGTLIGIAEKIGDNLADAVGICVGRRQSFGHLKVQANASGSQLGAGLRDSLINEPNHVSHFSLNFRLLYCHGLDFNQFVQYDSHTMSTKLDALQELALHVSNEAHRLSQEQVGITRNGGHGGAQFLRNRNAKLFPETLGFSFQGHVSQGSYYTEHIPSLVFEPPQSCHQHPAPHPHGHLHFFPSFRQGSSRLG